MTRAEIRIQLAKLESLELEIICLDNRNITQAVQNLYDVMSKEIYKDNEAALKSLKLA